MDNKINLKMATNDEILHLWWDAEERQDIRLLTQLKEETKRRIKYDC